MLHACFCLHLAILLGVTCFVHATLFNRTGSSRVRVACMDVHAFEHALGQYLQDHPDYPPADRWMEELVRSGEISRQQRPVDPWGHPYRLDLRNGEVAIRSLGPDGRAGTEDDLPPCP